MTNHALPQAGQVEPWKEDHLEFLIAFCAGLMANPHPALVNILRTEFPIESMRMALRLSQAYRELSQDTETLPWEARIQQHLQDAGALPT